MGVFRIRSLKRSAMDACRPWGAIFFLLLGTTAIASTLHDKQERHGEDTQKYQALVADNASREQRQALIDKPTSFHFAPLAAMKSTRQDVKEAQEQRALQSSCTEGDSFTITSSVYPLTEGCFSDLGLMSGDGKTAYESALFMVASLETSTTTSSEITGSYWFVVDSTSSDTSTTVYYYCYSAENSTALLHPADATWLCDVDGDGQFEFSTPSQFSTTCGCSTTTATTTDIDTTTTTVIGTTTTTSYIDSTNATFDNSTTTATDSESTSTTTSDIDSTTTSDITSSPTTTENSTTSTSQSDDTSTDIEPAAACAEGESFTINSTVLPDLNGCYITTNSFVEGEIVYTESGNRNAGQNFVNADDIGDGSTDIRWVVASVTVTDDLADCQSEDQATEVHPAEVDTWICTLDSVDKVVTEEEFSVTCGCSGGRLSVVLSTLTTFGVGFLATTLLLAGI